MPACWGESNMRNGFLSIVVQPRGLALDLKFVSPVYSNSKETAACTRVHLRKFPGLSCRCTPCQRIELLKAVGGLMDAAKFRFSLVSAAFLVAGPVHGWSQQETTAPIVQPGAPGQDRKRRPPSTTGLPT